MEFSCRGIPFLAIFFQTLPDDALQFRPGLRTKRGNRFGCGMQNPIHRFSCGPSSEGLMASHHFIENDAETEDVGALVDIVTEDLFGAHVARGPHDNARAGLNPGRELAVRCAITNSARQR